MTTQLFKYGVGVASYMYMCMQVHDSDQCQCKQDQHYTQAVSPSCNHPNGDGWPALSTGQRDVERVCGRRPRLLVMLLNYCTVIHTETHNENLEYWRLD